MSVQPVIVVTSMLPAPSSSHLPSAVMRDIEGLASLVLTDLAAIFHMNFSVSVDLVAIIPTLQLPTIEGPVLEGSLEPKVATLGLDSF